MKQPKVSIVSVFYNRAKYVAASVQSLIDQTYENVEILVVDDGSTDNTWEEMQQFAGHSKVRLFTHANRGFTPSIKTVIEKEATGELIAIHGSGDISLAERIEKQVSYLLDNENVVAVGCKVKSFMPDGSWRIGHPKGDQWRAGSIPRSAPFTHGEVMYRRSAYDAVGGYRIAFKYSQDYDLWLRMINIGKFAVLDALLYERPAVEGTVRHNIYKVLAQKRYACLGRLSANQRLRNAPDIINVVGMDAILYCKYDLSTKYIIFKMLLKTDFTQQTMDRWELLKIVIFS